MTAVIRHATREDMAFIGASWRDSFAESALAHSMTAKIYEARWTTLTRHLAELATRGNGVSCLVLTEPDAPTVILGWLLHEGGALHYVFVRENFRRMGYARELLGSAPALRSYTSRTVDWQVLLNAKRTPADRLSFVRRLDYDPSALWRHFGDFKHGAISAT